jgi:hypothetical protein
MLLCRWPTRLCWGEEGQGPQAPPFRRYPGLRPPRRGAERRHHGPGWDSALSRAGARPIPPPADLGLDAAYTAMGKGSTGWKPCWGGAPRSFPILPSAAASSSQGTSRSIGERYCHPQAFMSSWRWVVERTFGWIDQHSRMSKSETWISIVMTRLMVRRSTRS